MNSQLMNNGLPNKRTKTEQLKIETMSQTGLDIVEVKTYCSLLTCYLCRLYIVVRDESNQ